MKKRDVSNYRGESPGKKEARLLVLEMTREELGRKTFSRGPHLILASREVGDIPVLLELGARPDSIFAIDRDKHELAIAKHRYRGSGINFSLCSFERAHVELGISEFALAYIDLCAPIREYNVQALIKIRARMTAFEFECCREQGPAARIIRSTKRSHPAESRLAYLKLKGFHPTLGIHYVSSTETTKGSPMCIALKGSKKPRSPPIVEVKATNEEIRKRVTYSTGESMGNLYNIPKETVAGWRSWEVRYGNTRRRWSK